MSSKIRFLLFFSIVACLLCAVGGAMIGRAFF